MKFAKEKFYSDKCQSAVFSGKLNREELEKRVVMGANLVIKKYKKALIKLGDT
ncbi:MAG: hypothetical protein WC768_02510 [Patescibacteria group bacterium]|jgi:hypothetical protein